MTREETNTPKTFKYSIWDTRTADDQPNINLKAVKETELSTTETNQTPDETK